MVQLSLQSPISSSSVRRCDLSDVSRFQKHTLHLWQAAIKQSQTFGHTQSVPLGRYSGRGSRVSASYWWVWKFITVKNTTQIIWDRIQQLWKVIPVIFSFILQHYVYVAALWNLSRNLSQSVNFSRKISHFISGQLGPFMPKIFKYENTHWKNAYDYVTANLSWDTVWGTSGFHPRCSPVFDLWSALIWF